VASDLNGQVSRERRQRRGVPPRRHDCRCRHHAMRSMTRPTKGSCGGVDGAMACGRQRAEGLERQSGAIDVR
jgi:hypothetical protein